MNFRV